jgi:hypothetical protein
MKKISIICYALLASFMLVIAGCGEEEEAVGDTTPPTVKEVIVAGDTSAVATNGPIMIVLSEAVDPASVHGALTFTPQADGSISYDENVRTLTFTPETDLQSNANYSITVSGIEDKSGNVMEPFTLDIATSERDDEPPTIVATTPSDGEPEAPTEPRFNVGFSERIDQTEFGQDLSLTPDPGIPAEQWFFTWSEDGKQMQIFIPLEGGLEAMVDYKLHIGASCVVDLVGNCMEESLGIEFTTTSPPHEDIDPRSPTDLAQAWLYVIWKDQQDIWHIVWGGNTLPGGVNTGAGTIFSEDGAIDDVSPVLWEAGDQQNLADSVLTFNGPVNGTGGRDGLTFKVNGKTVTFDLKNAQPDQEDPPWIYIGKDRKNPQSPIFTLLNEDN